MMHCHDRALTLYKDVDDSTVAKQAHKEENPVDDARSQSTNLDENVDDSTVANQAHK